MKNWWAAKYSGRFAGSTIPFSLVARFDARQNGIRTTSA